MSPDQIEYIHKLASNADCLDNLRKEIFAYWTPELPPITCVFSDFGSEIAKRFYDLTDNQRLFIFANIESGMNTDDSSLKDAIATGLIEELVKAGDEDKHLWAAIEAALGPESKDYAITWKNFDYSLPPKTNLT